MEIHFRGQHSDKHFVVDKEDYDMINQSKWYLDSVGYPVYNNGQSTCRLHRELMKDKLSGDLQVDHIDGNKLNNQRSNLRVCTQQQNLQNRRKFDGANRQYTSKLKGVSFVKGTRRWRARIQRINIGTFDTQELAHEAYSNKAREIFGEFCRSSTTSS
jgi:hypothetical protein